MAKAHPLDPEFAPGPAIFRPRPPVLSEETRGMVLLVLLFVVPAMLLICGMGFTTWLKHQRDLAAIRAGLVQGEIEGRDGVFWVRPETKP